MSLDKNFGLSKEKFIVLLQELKNGNETLFEEIFLNNFQSTCLYIKNKCKIDYDRAYDVTMNTLLEYRLRLLDDKIIYGNLKYLFTQMAYHNFVKTVRENKKLEKIPPLGTRGDEALQSNEAKMQKLLEIAFKKLEVGCRILLDKFYFLGISYEAIAKEEAISNQAVRKRKERCLNKLKTLIGDQIETTDLNYEQFRGIFE